MMAGFRMGWKRVRGEVKPPQGRDCPTNQGETGTGWEEKVENTGERVTAGGGGYLNRVQSAS